MKKKLKLQVIKRMVIEARFRCNGGIHCSGLDCSTILDCRIQSREGGQLDYQDWSRGELAKQLNIHELEEGRELHFWERLNSSRRIILRAKRAGAETGGKLRLPQRTGENANQWLKKNANQQLRKSFDERLSVQMTLELKLYGRINLESLYKCLRQHLALAIQEDD